MIIGWNLLFEIPAVILSAAGVIIIACMNIELITRKVRQYLRRRSA